CLSRTGRPQPVQYRFVRLRWSGRWYWHGRRHFLRKLDYRPERLEPAATTSDCELSMKRIAGIGEEGFTLLEMVCVVALVATVAAVLLPYLPRNTSRARLQAYALEAATLLKSDR